MGEKKRARYREPMSRRSRERLANARKRFDFLCGLLALTIVVATLCCMGRDYELGAPYPPGFALWFLLILAYVPLEIVGLVNWFLGMSESSWMTFLTVEHQALGMGIFNLALLAVIWGGIRFWLSRRYGINLLRTAGTFVTIFLVWGLFQLLCLAGVTIWDRGGFTPLHRHLHRPLAPEKVIVVEPELSLEEGIEVPNGSEK